MNFNLGDIFAVLTAFCWSSAVILFELSGKSLTSLQISLIKNIIGVIGFTITIILMDISFLDFTKSEIATLIISGILGVAIGDLFFLKSLSIVGSGVSAILATIYVPSIFLIANLFFGEEITGKAIVGGALICFAIFIGVYKKQELKKSKLFVKAVTLGILAQVFTAISVLMVKPIMGNHNVVSIALIRFGTGLFITLIYIYCTQGLSIIRKTFNDGFSNWYVISGSLLGTYLSVIFWLSGFKYTLASRAAIYNELSTIMIIILASIFLKESMTKQKWIAIIFAVSGGLIVGIK